MESLVCVFGFLAAESPGSANRGATAGKRSRRAEVICRQSLRRQPSTPGTRRVVAILVYLDAAKAGDGQLVDPQAARPLRPGTAAGCPRQRWHPAYAGSFAAT